MDGTQLRKLIEDRKRAIDRAREISDAAETESRAMTDEERGHFDTAMGDVGRLSTAIQNRRSLTEQDALSAEIAEFLSAEDRAAQGGQGDVDDDDPNAETRSGAGGGEQRTLVEQNAGLFRSFVLSDDFAVQRTLALSGELRALQADVDTAGGYLVAPEQWVAELIKNLDNEVFMRRICTTHEVPTAKSLGAPSLESDPADPVWTAEIGTGDEDSTMSFGARHLYPHPLAKRIKVSRRLLRASRMDAEEIVRNRLGYKFGTTEENSFLNGSGAEEPLGVFVASASGIPTGRDVSDGNTNTRPTFDGLTRAKWSIKPGYWPALDFIAHRDVMVEIAVIKDGEGRFVWRDSVRAGEPDRVLNVPLSLSEYAPSTLTTGLYVGIFGAFKNYWIATALDMEIQRLDELYAETNQVGFIGRLEADGMPVRSEAFARITLT